MTSLVTTVTETLRYRGAIGQWSWVLHRLSGLGIVFFLVIHVIDTSWAVFYPALYVEAIAEYQTPLFTIGEFGLVAAVVYHALNGLRIIIFDFKPDWWQYQRKAAWGVLVATAVVLLPTFLVMFQHVLDYYAGDPELVPLTTIIINQSRFLVGIAVAIVASVLISALYGSVAGNQEKSPTAADRRMERFWWSYMRISGVLIIPLVFGHLAMMHVIQGVFDLTAANVAAVGANVGQPGIGLNETGTAVEFVGDRWNTLVAGVYVWRIYDAGLLALVVVHGFNGLRYVLTDYAPTPMVRRASVILCVAGAVVLLVVGGGALLFSVNDAAIELAVEAMETLH